VDTKHVFTLKKAVQPTVPLDSMTQRKTHNKETKSVDTDPANQHVDVDTKYEVTFDESEAYEDACQMDAIKSHLEEVKNAETKSVDTDPDKPQKSQVIDRRGNTDDAEMLADDTYQQAMNETYQEVDVNKPFPEKTKIPRLITIDSPLNNCMQRQTGFGDVAKKPAAPNAASEKGEPNTQKTLCHEGVQDCIDVPDVKVVPNVQDVANVQDVPNVQDSIDVPDVKAIPNV
jgi:hypothetical protein